MDRIEKEHEARFLIDDMLKTPNLRRHAFATGALMQALAERLGENELNWWLTGVLHDLDYEHTVQTPERHGGTGADILAMRSYPKEIVDAVRRHNEITKPPFPNKLELGLHVADATAWMVLAYALPPEGIALGEVTSQMVLSQWDEPKFAPEADRAHVLRCIELGFTLPEWLEMAQRAVQTVENDLELTKRA